MQRLVHLGGELVHGHAWAPLALRLQIDDRLDHFGRGRIGGGRGATRLAPDGFDLGEGLDDLVLGLQQLRGLGDGNPRQRDRHVEQRAFVERRHELGAELGGRPQARHQNDERDEDRGSLELERELDHRPIDPDQEPVHRILVLGHDAAAHEQRHQRRNQQDREQGRRGHGEGLGVGKRLEQPALLRLQREDRQEGDRDDEQAEEERRAHLDRGLDQHLGPRLAGRRALEPLMRVLDHDDGGIDHGADGDGDAAEAHDVGAQAQQPHADIGDQHAKRQRDDGDERAAGVQQEDDADQRHDGAFLEQGPLQGIDGAVDQGRAVVHRLDGHALGQARHDFGEAILHMLDDRQRVLAEALQRDAGDDLALAVQLGDATPLIWSELHAGNVLEQHRNALV